ncbi:lysophosphatidic acid receptor 6-like [Petromyzon marinus]|uniref:lysophosphatidic acid receptor 6-like n=1 Tax=Petromyzon marinus TaxID=7757 RepID=UPI003F72122B
MENASLAWLGAEAPSSAALSGAAEAFANGSLGAISSAAAAAAQSCEIDEGFKRTFYAASYSLIFVLGLLTNSVALGVFCCCLGHRTEATTYMFNLVLSDLFFIATLPFRAVYYVRGGWPFGDWLCKLSGVLFLTNMYGSVLFLTCICADRFLAIVHPFRSRTLRTPRAARAACVGVWLIVILGSSPSFLLKTTNNAGGTNASSPDGPRTCFENFPTNTWKSFLSSIVIFMEVVGFLIPLVVMVYCSCMILKTINGSRGLQRSPFDRRKIQRMITATVVIFVACFLPHHVVLVFYTLVRRDTITSCAALRAVKAAYPITLCLASANCCLDPIIYYFTTEAFRRSLRRGVNRGSSFLLSETLRVTESVMAMAGERAGGVNGRASLTRQQSQSQSQV